MRLYYVAFGSERWTWQPMLWVIAILTMVVGTLLAMAQTDIKRMLAYSSVAHTGFLLTGVLGVQSASDMADGQIGALQAVLFYLVTYGFMTLGAFAIVSMVRDASGEATHLSRWAGLGKESPIVAGVFAFFLLSMAGIPLTAGFAGKWAVFAAAMSAGAWPVVVVAVLASAGAAFFYVRVIVLMYFSDPVGAGPSVTVPSVLTAVDHRDGGRLDADPGHRARPGARPGGPCGRIHQVSDSSASSGLALPILDEALAERLTARMAEVEDALAGPRDQPGGVRHHRRAAPPGRRRQAVPAAAGAAGRGDRAGRRLRRGGHRGLRGRADPPRLALPRRRDGRGRAAPRRRLGQRPVGQPRRDPHRRLPVLQELGADRRARAATPYASRRRPSPGSSRARSWRPSRPRPAPTRSSTTSPWWPARPAR